MKFLKIFCISVITFILVLYLTFLFILPNVVDLNKFKPDIQKIVKEQSKLNIDFSNAKIIVTPLLAAGISVNNININLPDNSEILKADSFEGKISLPHLIFKTVKVTEANIINPQINVDIVDGKEYKIAKHFEVENVEQIENADTQTLQKDNLSINLDIPKIKISNYSLLINDLKTLDYLKLQGDELVFAYRNGKSASIKTNAQLYVNDNKNITADIDIDTFLPTQVQNDETVKIEQKEENQSFINPVAIYKAYDLKANINSKLKIRQKGNKIVSTGYLNIDNLTLMISGLKLGESKIHITSNNTKIESDSELFITDTEKCSIITNIDYGKNNEWDIKLKSNEIHTENALRLTQAILNSANIQNELDTIKGSGYFVADTKIKTDFKKLESQGSVNFNDIDIRKIKDNSRIAKINSIISLDNSILKFINTTVEVFDTTFAVDGTINEKSYADISVLMQKMTLENVFKMFLPKDINNTYTVNSGMINLNADIKGELKSLTAKIKMSLSNLSIKDRINNIVYFNNLFAADFESDLKTFKGVINNSDFKMIINGANINCDKFSMNVGDSDIVINPSIIKINNSTNFDLNGTVSNYINNPIFNIDAKGAVTTSDLKQVLGNNLAIYLKDKGKLPINVNISGDNKKQTIIANISANSENYITPINILKVENKDTEISTIIEIKDNKLTIKDSGFFVKENGVKTEIAGVEGLIMKLDTPNPIINVIKIRIPNDISGSLVIFPQSKLTAKGDIVVSGELSGPKIRGDLSIFNISIPELSTQIERITAKFEDKNLDMEFKKILADGSDINIIMNADLTPSKYFTIRTLNLISSYIDSDKLMKVSDLLTKYTTPESNNSTNVSNDNAIAADIPCVIKDGSIDIQELKSGDIILNETSGKISLNKNVFYINNLITSIFKGKMQGDVSMNLISSEIKANVKGNSLDVEKTLKDAANMKDTLTGTMDFDANIALKGTSYEDQVKTLKGNVNFTMKDGSLGPLGRIENLVAADNLSSTSSLKTLVNTALKSTVDTSKYNTLKGHLSFDNGIAQINPITSSGDYMSAYIWGNFDVLKNYADLKLRGRLGSKVTDSMGQLAMLNPVYVVKSSSNMNMILGTLLLTLCEKVTDSELAQIPTITKETSDENTAKFQVVLRGDVAKPLKLVRSFKWLATEEQIKEAKNYLGNLSIISVPTDVKELKQQAKDIVKNLMSEGSKQTTQQGKDVVNSVKSLLNNTTVTKQDGTKTTLKEQLNKVKTNALKQLTEQAQQQQNSTDSDVEKQ